MQSKNKCQASFNSWLIHTLAILLTALSSPLLMAEEFEAPEFDVSEFMYRHGLKPFNLDEMIDEQKFSNSLYLSLNSGEISVSKKRVNPNQSSLKVGEAKYEGFNKGEWGGKLVVTVDGQTQELMSGNIVHLQKLDGKLFIFEGVAHGFPSGSISVIEDIHNPTTPTLITRLPDAPQLVYLDATRPDYKRMIIVGSKSVMSLDPTMGINIRYWDAFWRAGLKPTSIVRFEDNFFIGLQHGIAVVPAPWGESSKYCKDRPRPTTQYCKKVHFYADDEFTGDSDKD